MIWLFVLISCLCGPLIGYKLGQYFFGTKQKRLSPEALNVINGLVLPEPDDPRWYLIEEGYFALGEIQVCSGKIWFKNRGSALWIDHRKLVAYYNAIHDSIQSAIAFDSILNAKMPPKPKKLKAIKKDVEKSGRVLFDESYLPWKSPKVEVVSSGPPNRSLAEIINDPPKLQLNPPEHMYR